VGTILIIGQQIKIMPYSQLNSDQLKILPLSSRKSKTKIEDVMIDPDSLPPPVSTPEILSTIEETARRMVHARKKGASIVLAFGAHLVKNGSGPILAGLMKRGWLTHLATQGAGAIHDWEFAFLGETEEDVRQNVPTGTFGTWDETGKYINLAIQIGAIQGMGFGESLGALIFNEGMEIPHLEALRADIAKRIEGQIESLPAKIELLETIKKFNLPAGFMRVPHSMKSYSIFNQGYRLKIPVTVHPGIGYDIIINHPHANGAAMGRGGHMDFKIFAESVSRLTHGVFLSVGSAVMAPQIFEKALSFANNLKLQQGDPITDHFILVNDLHPSTWEWERGEPPKNSSDYYHRFFKTFHRMGGKMRYLQCDNRVFLHHLYWKLREMSKDIPEVS
jgi:hypothetical protein